MPIELSVLITRYTWLTPAVLELAEKDLVQRREFTRILGIEIGKDLARSILWTLSKLGLVEKIDEGIYKVTDLLKIRASQLRQHVVNMHKHRLLLRFGNLYYVVTIRREKITVRKVEVDVVNKIEDLLRNSEKTIKEIVDSTGLKTDKVTTALRVLELYNKIEKVIDNEKVKYRIKVSH